MAETIGYFTILFFFYLLEAYVVFNVLVAVVGSGHLWLFERRSWNSITFWVVLFLSMAVFLGYFVSLGIDTSSFREYRNHEISQVGDKHFVSLVVLQAALARAGTWGRNC